MFLIRIISFIRITTSQPAHFQTSLDFAVSMPYNISSMKDPGELALKLQKARKEKGFTYQQFAEKTSLSIATIEAIFQGKQKNPTLTTLQKICDMLDLSIDKLINRENFIVYRRGKETIFYHDKNKTKKDIVVPTTLLDKIEDKEGLITIVYLEANKNFEHQFLPFYDALKIFTTKGTALVNGRKLKPFDTATFDKKTIKKGVKLKAKKGTRGIICMIPGVKVKA